MATLFYRVYHNAGAVADGAKTAEGTVNIAATSTQSSTVIDSSGGNQSRRVRLMADADCFVEWGDNPTAANDGSSGMPLGAENPEYVWMLASDQIAVIERA